MALFRSAVVLPVRECARRVLSSETERPVAILFPGQGSQYVGMPRKYLDIPGAREIFKTARSVLGYDLLKLCLEGPEKILKLTYYCQPAVLCTSLAALEWLKVEKPEVLKRCVATAGFSVGELTALAFSGALTVEDAFSIVRVRAKAMHDASHSPPSGMLTVIGLPPQELSQLLLDAEGDTGGVAVIGNYLWPNTIAVSGTDDTLQRVVEITRERGVKTKRINVAGAFHSPLMSTASVALHRVMVGTPMSVPRVPVYCNVTGQAHTEPEQISRLFSKQLLLPVRWQGLIENMSSDYGPDIECWEVGPGRQLSAMVTRTRKSREGIFATDSK